MKTPNIPGAQKTQVQGNRQGGGDQRGKSNRPGGGIPATANMTEKAGRMARDSRDPKGSAHSATLVAVAREPVE